MSVVTGVSLHEKSCEQNAAVVQANHVYFKRTVFLSLSLFLELNYYGILSR